MLAPVMVLGALGMILSRKPVHSALCLAAVMISLAVQYAAQDAPFLFVVQIIVYTGAILMLFLFVLMLVGVDAADSLVETIRGQRVWAVIAGRRLRRPAGVRGRQRRRRLRRWAWTRRTAEHGGNVQGIAALIFTRYVFAFEATAALLITAALGAMVLAHRERLHRQEEASPSWSPSGCRSTPRPGQHPGPLPSPGVFARHNAVDTPALLPDGTASELSVSATLRARGTVADARELAAPIEHTLREIESGRRRRT